MSMTMTQKILASHAGLEEVKAGQLIEADLDLVMANDITGPMALPIFSQMADTVFDKDQVEKLWNLSKGITTPNMYMDNLGAKLPDITPISTNKSVDIGGINVNVDKVVTDNPEDLTRQLTNELAGNSKIQKILGEINSNQLLGRNSLSTRRYMK